MMMDPAVKTAMAFCVLLAGVCAALLVGRDPARPAKPTPAKSEELRIPGKKGPGLLARPRRQANADYRRSPRGQDRAAADAAADGGRNSPTVLSPSQAPQSPPPLADEYPPAGRPAESRWGESLETLLPLPATRDQGPQTHKIVDGDTLPALAERYLGSASRAEEIFAANRDVLTDPQLLPIGAELKIPAK